MKRVGLTGVMGSGKSSVIKLLKKKGITVLDCDAMNKELQRKGNAGYCALVQQFGDQILSATLAIDSKKLSDLLFQDEVKRKQAEAILHPLIKDMMEASMQKHHDEALVVTEVPLLFEIHWESCFDEIWVVASKESLLLHRLQTYRGISRKEAKRRLAVQMPQNEKVSRADVVLWNDRDIQYLEEQLHQIL